MSFAFTTFLESLDASGHPCSTTDFPALWSALRGALRRELRRRGLWDSSPRYLGVAGSPCWYPAERRGCMGRSATSWFPGDALDELATEIYLRIFVTRLPSLRRHLERKPNIDGLVHRAIRQVLHDIQKRHDPLGYRIYKISRSALRLLITKKQLHPIDEAPRIANKSLFSFDAGTSPGELSEGLLEERVRRFNDELFPDLLVARGRELRQIVGRLAAMIGNLRKAGVRTFSFRQLIDPFKTDTRNRWGVFLANSPFGIDALGHEARCYERLPDDGLEARDRFEKLSRCIEGRLEALGGQQRTREHRRKLWWFLRLFASDESAAALPTLFGNEELPSNRELARLLDIPRGRLPGLFAELGAAAEECLDTLARQPEGLGSPTGVALPRPKERDGALVCRILLARTAETWQRGTRPRPRPARQQADDSRDATGPVAASSVALERAEGSAVSRRAKRFRLVRRPPRARERSSWRGLRSVAAGIVLLVSVGVILMMSHRQLRGPRLEGSLAHLVMSGDRVTRGAPAHPILELGPGDSAVVLVVAVPTTPGPAHFELRAWRREAGSWSEVLWQGLVDPRGEREQAILLPADRLELGTLRLELVSTEDSVTVRTYTFEVRPTSTSR